MSKDRNAGRQIFGAASRDLPARLTAFDYVDMFSGPVIIGLVVWLLLIVLT